MRPGELLDEEIESRLAALPAEASGFDPFEIGSVVSAIRAAGMAIVDRAELEEARADG